MPSISAVIISYNEERHIERCIKSLLVIADEVVVLDSYSTDRTPEICKELGVTFHQQAFAGYIEQKNHAMRLASHDIILSLDADEVLSERLTQSIREVKDNWTHDGYRFNRLNNFCGQWMRYTNYYPDRKLRLFNRRKARWGGVNPHDMILMDKGSRVGHLKGDLLHWMCESLHEHLQTIDRFSAIAASEAFKKGVRASAWKVFYKPIWRFIQYYLIKRGFLDGYMGLVVSRHASFLCFQKYARLRELQKKNHPKVAVIISTYNEAAALEKALDAWLMQTHYHFELLVADDGSQQDTARVIEKHDLNKRMPIKHIWHEDAGFRKCTILNKAIMATNADYLIFSDGDCIPRNDFVENHLKYAERGRFLSGGYVKLNEKVSENVKCDQVVTQSLFSMKQLLRNGQDKSIGLLKLTSSNWLALLLNWFTPTRATWNGHNSSGWKSDIVAVNGFNEDMEYGGLDRELGERLKNAGVRGKQVRYRAICLHLNHSRPYRDARKMQQNLEQRKKVKKEKITWTENGIYKGRTV